MKRIDVPIRIAERDTIVIDGGAMRVQSITDDEIQLSTPGSFTDTVTTPEELEQTLASAGSVALYR